jgi:sporulation integral membrane protein YtvI
MPDVLRKTIYTVIKILLIALGVFILLKVGGYLIPFILAFFFSSLIEPLVRFIENKLRINRKIGAVFTIVVVLGAVVTVLGFLVARLVKEIINVYNSLNLTIDNIAAFIENMMAKANNIFVKLPVELTDGISNAIADFATNLENIMKPVLGIAQGTIEFAFSIPQALIFIIVTILATYFMSSDKYKIGQFLEKQVPSDWLKNTREVTNNIFVALFGWLKAQLILMTITFSELLLGLLIIGIDNALLLALVIALVDALPVLGTGTILLPWAAINLLTGNTRLGFSLALLYVIILFVRQLIEPKVVGQQIGVHPLFTLFGMYLGLQFIGVLGMFLGPICTVIIKYILEGVLKTEGLKGWFERNFKSKAPAPAVEDRDDAAPKPP